MSYGIKVVNDDERVQIDGSYKVMQLKARGSAAPGGTTVNFPEAVTTEEPPWVFLRGNGYLLGAAFVGSAGAWTGFRFHSASSLNHNHSGPGRGYGTWEYIMGSWSVAPSGDEYGMRVYDSSQTLLWDAGNKIIKLMAFFPSWNYSSTLTYVRDLGDDGSLSDPENFMLINPIARESFIQIGGLSYGYRIFGPFNGRNMYVKWTLNWNNSSGPSPNTYDCPVIVGRVGK